MTAAKREGKFSLEPFIKIKFFQRDFIPGFGGYVSGSVHNKPYAEILLNVGGMLGALRMGDVGIKDLPYEIAASMIHEITHVFEDWARVKFSERRVGKIVRQYERAYKKHIKNSRRDRGDIRIR
jgi:hypothetical protein